jgi:hypothetical protein
VDDEIGVNYLAIDLSVSRVPAGPRVAHEGFALVVHGCSISLGGRHRERIENVREAFRIVLRREHLRQTMRIALIVGVILTLINQADVIFGGDATAGTWIKTGLNFCVPFVVSNLGLIAGKRAQAEASGNP